MILRNYITELYYGTILQDDTTELCYGIMLRNYIMESYYVIILRNEIVEIYYGIIFMKRIQGMPRTSMEPPGITGSPEHAPGAPGDTHGTTRRRPWDPPGTPWDPWGPTGRPNGRSSTNMQHQKLSIGAFEPARWGQSPEGLPWTVLSTNNTPKSKNDHPVPGFPRAGYG